MSRKPNQAVENAVSVTKTILFCVIIKIFSKEYWNYPYGNIPMVAAGPPVLSVKM